MTLVLDEQERSWLSGAEGEAMKLAMRLVVAAAEVSGATRLIPIEMAHINSCHYSGRLSLDFAEFLLAEGATLSVPTHTNASLISCTSPELRAEADAPDEVAGARRVMEIYEELGCSPMWTCAPYQQAEGRPGFGQQIVGSESNAVGFFNAVLGARTNKYGDFLDISGAMVGRVPYSGLHTDDGRRATHRIDLSGLPTSTIADPNLPHLLGALLGREVGSRVGAIEGVESASEDELKAIAAGAAATGGVEMFHVVGITPEAPSLDEATHGIAPTHTTEVTQADLAKTAALLTSATGDERLRAICLGTPHFSVAEFVTLAEVLNGRRVHESVSMVVTTSRAVSAELELRGLNQTFMDAGVQVVLDTCTYFTPRPAGVDGLTLTNSAKWAYYSQGILGVPVAFAGLEECVDSAVAGRWLR